MFDKMAQRHLGCVAGAVEHGFARKKPAKGDSVDAAGELFSQPAFHAVSVSRDVKQRVGFEKLTGDPGACAARPRTRATLHHLSESLIDRDSEDSFADQA